jgi:TolB protein
MIKKLALFLSFSLLLFSCGEGRDVLVTATSLSATKTPFAAVEAQPSPSVIPSPVLSSPTPYPPEKLAFASYDFQPGQLGPAIQFIGLSSSTIFFANNDGSFLEQPALFAPYRSGSTGVPMAGSPDGQYLVFGGGTKEGDYQLYLADISNNNVVALTSGRQYFSALLGHPAWSPDSNYLVSSLATTAIDQEGQEYLAFNLFVIDIDARQARRLTTSFSSDIYPSWSPDGQWIAFARYPYGPRPGPLFPESRPNGQNHVSLYLIRPDGSELKLLIDSAVVADEIYTDDALYNILSWSPDSLRLAYMTGDKVPDVEIIDIETGETQTLASSPAKDQFPSWSPDGSQVLFVTDRDGNNEIYVIATDGTHLVNLTQNPASDIYPVWSPSGRFIAFLSDRQEPHAYELYTMNSDGTGQTRISIKTEAEPGVATVHYVFKRPIWLLPQQP